MSDKNNPSGGDAGRAAASAARLHPTLRAQRKPTTASFQTKLSAAAAADANPCAGKPQGTPCFVWHNPDGSTTVCTCDGLGNCVYPE